MSDPVSSVGLVGLLVTLIGSLAGNVLNYLNNRQKATVDRDERDDARNEEREKEMNKRVDAFIATQTNEIQRLGAEYLLAMQRLDAMNGQVLQLQHDVYVCQKERAELGIQLTLDKAQIEQQAQRILKLEAQTAA